MGAEEILFLVLIPFVVGAFIGFLIVTLSRR